MLITHMLRPAFALALPFDKYLATATKVQRPAWDEFMTKVALTHAQTELVRTFHRRINVLVISGTWCGDCVQQCPILHRIAEARPHNLDPAAGGIELRFLDRDKQPEIQDAFQICGGRRIPVAIFMNEDFDFVSMHGDRTLSRYRAMAAAKLGASCPVPGAPVPSDEVAATTADWLNEFERVALLLRLSHKLRAKHGD
ncbi:MAG: thioredoxin family protein [Phycisphaerales bacterium]